MCLARYFRPIDRIGFNYNLGFSVVHASLLGCRRQTLKFQVPSYRLSQPC